MSKLAFDKFAENKTYCPPGEEDSILSITTSGELIVVRGTQTEVIGNTVWLPKEEKRQPAP